LANRPQEPADDGPVYQGKTFRAWVAQLQDKDQQARLEAAGVLGRYATLFRELSPDAAVAALGQALKDKDRLVRSVAGRSLGFYGRHKIPVFVEALKDPDPGVRRDAANNLLSDWPVDPAALAEAVPALGELLLKDKVPEVREAAAMSLWRIGQPSVPILITAVQSGDKEARRLAVNALSRVGPQARKAVPVLIPLLKQEDPQLRFEVCPALKAMRDQAGEAVPALLMLSKDPESGKEALDALQGILHAPRSAAPALLALLKDEEPRVRLKAAEYLFDLEEWDKECLAVLLELVKRRDPAIRLGAANLLCRYGSAAKEAVPALIEVVRHEADSNARHAAIFALGAIGPEARAAVPALKAAALGNNRLNAAVQAALKKIEE
jgi:HEAT repeat protein